MLLIATFIYMLLRMVKVFLSYSFIFKTLFKNKLSFKKKKMLNYLLLFNSRAPKSCLVTLYMWMDH